MTEAEEEVGVSDDDEVEEGAGMIGGSPGISGVLSRMLPGVPEDDLE